MLSELEKELLYQKKLEGKIIALTRERDELKSDNDILRDEMSKATGFIAEQNAILNEIFKHDSHTCDECCADGMKGLVKDALIKNLSSPESGRI